MFQSSRVPQKPLSDFEVVQVEPVLLVAPESLSRSSYIAKKNSLSLISGPDSQPFHLVKSARSRLP